MWLVCTSYWEVQFEKPNCLLKYFPSAGCSLILCIGEKTIMLTSKLIPTVDIVFTSHESAKNCPSLRCCFKTVTLYICTVQFYIKLVNIFSSQPGATHCVFSPCANMCFNLPVWVKTTILHHPYQYCNANSNHLSDTVIWFCEIPMKWCS